MKELDKLYTKIVQQIREYEALAKEEGEAKLKYIIAQRLRLYRAKNGFTQDQLATQLGVNRIQIIRWEQGFCKPQKWVIRLLQEKGILKI